MSNFHQQYAEHKAVLLALESGTATPEQQKAAFAHLQAVKKQHNEDMREADREARSAYSEGRWDGKEESESRNYY